MAEQLFVRGTTIDAARRFLLRDKGTPEWELFSERLTPEQRALIDQKVNASAWYPAALYIAVLEHAARTVARGDVPGYLNRLGHFVLDDGVNSLYRAFFAIASPSFVIRGSALLWRMFFKGNKLKIRHSSRRSVTVAIVDTPVLSHELCLSIVGGMEASLQHAGAKNLKFELRNCGEGKCNHCDFHFTWVR